MTCFTVWPLTFTGILSILESLIERLVHPKYSTKAAHFLTYLYWYIPMQILLV